LQEAWLDDEDTNAPFSSLRSFPIMATNPPPRHRTRLLFGLLLVVLPAITLALPAFWQWADLDPRPIFTLSVIGQSVTTFCVLALPIWVLFFSGFAGRTKGIVLGLMLLLAGTAVAAIDSVKLTGDLRPIPHFRWQGRPEELLEQHLKEAGDSTDLAPIDLTIDRIQDFPRYRGSHGDGIVTSNDLLEWNWTEYPPRLLWRQPCGGGFAGFALAGNVAITIEQRRDQEVIVCYDRATGKERWTYSYRANFRHPTGNGPRATPAITDDGYVYSMGAEGMLVCLDGKTGREKWSVDVVKDNSAKVVMWGMTSSPLIVGDLVIVNAGVDPENNAARALVAYRRSDGAFVWGAGKNRAGYSSPQKVRLAGRDQVLLFNAGGLAGYDPKTGEELWQYPFVTGMDMNIIQPLVLGDDRVFIASETSKGCELLKISRKGNTFAAEPLWANFNLCSKFANPVAVGGAIYGLSNGTLVCIDQDSGRRLWRGRTYGHGQILAVGRNVRAVLIVLSERGYVAVVSADRKGFQERARMDVFKDRTWNTPALAGRRLFLRNDVEMACYELPVME
jgi:outer membrane protein assembly factor BamB